MTQTQSIIGQVAHFDHTGETATVIGYVLDNDEPMIAVRWNGSGRITHEYRSDLHF
jgi:hypothetical protein